MRPLEGIKRNLQSKKTTTLRYCQVSGSPSNTSKWAVGEATHKQFPNLIHGQNTERERYGDQPEFDRDRGSAEKRIDARDLSDKDRYHKRRDSAKHKPRVSSLGAKGIRLEDRKSFVSDREEVSPLQYDQGHEIYALAGVIEIY